MQSGLRVYTALHQTISGKRVNPVLRSIVDLSHAGSIFNFTSNVSQLSYQIFIKPNLTSSVLAPIHQFFKYTVAQGVKSSVPILGKFLGSANALSVTAEVGYVGVNLLFNFRRRKMEYIMLYTIELYQSQGKESAFKFINSYINHFFAFSFISFDYDLMKKFRWVLEGYDQVITLSVLQDLHESWVTDTNYILHQIAPKKHMHGLVELLNMGKLVYFLKKNSYIEAQRLIRYPGVDNNNIRQSLYRTTLIQAFDIFYGDTKEKIDERGKKAGEFIDHVLIYFSDIKYKDLFEALSAYFKISNKSSEAIHSQDKADEFISKLDQVIRHSDNQDFSFILKFMKSQKFEISYKRKSYIVAKALINEVRTDAEILNGYLNHVVLKALSLLVQKTVDEAQEAYNEDVRELEVADIELLSNFFTHTFSNLLVIDKKIEFYNSKYYYKLIQGIELFKTGPILNKNKLLSDEIARQIDLLKKFQISIFLKDIDDFRRANPKNDVLEKYEALAEEIKLTDNPLISQFRDALDGFNDIIHGNTRALTKEKINLKLTQIAQFLHIDLSKAQFQELPYFAFQVKHVNLVAALKSLSSRSPQEAHLYFKHLSKFFDEEDVHHEFYNKLKSLTHSLYGVSEILDDHNFERFIQIEQDISQVLEDKRYPQIFELINILLFIKRSIAERIGHFYLSRHQKLQASRYFEQALASLVPSDLESQSILIHKIHLCRR